MENVMEIATYKRMEIPTGIVDQIKWWALKGKTRRELELSPYGYKPGTIRVAFRSLIVKGELIEARHAHLVSSSTRRERSEEKNKARREYFRKNYVGTVVDGKHVMLKTPDKRPYPGHCELCRSEYVVLAYHHWDSSNPSKGIWLCSKHHMFAEAVDKGLLVEYLRLKADIEEEFRLKTVESVLPALFDAVTNLVMEV